MFEHKHESLIRFQTSSIQEYFKCLGRINDSQPLGNMMRIIKTKAGNHDCCQFQA